MKLSAQSSASLLVLALKPFRGLDIFFTKKQSNLLIM